VSFNIASNIAAIIRKTKLATIKDTSMFIASPPDIE
jgi:hypothetical protein